MMASSTFQDAALVEDWEVLSNKSSASSSSDVLLPSPAVSPPLAAGTPDAQQHAAEPEAKAGQPGETLTEEEQTSESLVENEPEAAVLTAPAAAASSVPTLALPPAGAESGVLVDGSEAALGAAASEATTIVLVGAVGSGKSASGNTIVGRPAFTARHAAGPVTKQSDMATLEDAERSLIVVDTPGLGETGSQAEAARQEVVKALAAAAQRGGRLAVAIVISAATPYSSADHAAVCSLVAHFGAELLKRALLVFTGDDLLASDGATLADYLADAPPDLQAVLQQVSGRTTVLDNRADAAGRERQAGAFFAVVDGLLSGSSQLGSFSAHGWALSADDVVPPLETGALRAHIGAGLQDEALEEAAGSPAKSRASKSTDTHAARLAAALAASESRRLQLERTVRDMPRLRRGIAYALTACGMLGLRMLTSSRESPHCRPVTNYGNLYGPICWSLEPCQLITTESLPENSLSVVVSPRTIDIASH